LRKRQSNAKFGIAFSENIRKMGWSSFERTCGLIQKETGKRR
jgi:hypothetical protein